MASRPTRPTAAQAPKRLLARSRSRWLGWWPWAIGLPLLLALTLPATAWARPAGEIASCSQCVLPTALDELADALPQCIPIESDLAPRGVPICLVPGVSAVAPAPMRSIDGAEIHGGSPPQGPQLQRLLVPSSNDDPSQPDHQAAALAQPLFWPLAHAARRCLAGPTPTGCGARGVPERVYRPPRPHRSAGE